MSRTGDIAVIVSGVALVMSLAALCNIFLWHTRTIKGPLDVLIHDQAYCAARMQQRGKHIILDGAELGPCTTKDIGRNP